MRLSTAQKDMLGELKRHGVIIAGRWDFSLSKVPQQLIKKGLVEVCEHPDVHCAKYGGPAKAYRLTDAGKML